jgi:hypothetical protein
VCVCVCFVMGERRREEVKTPGGGEKGGLTLQGEEGKGKRTYLSLCDGFLPTDRDGGDEELAVVAGGGERVGWDEKGRGGFQWTRL